VVNAPDQYGHSSQYADDPELVIAPDIQRGVTRRYSFDFSGLSLPPSLELLSHPGHSLLSPVTIRSLIGRKNKPQLTICS